MTIGGPLPRLCPIRMNSGGLRCLGRGLKVHIFLDFTPFLELIGQASIADAGINKDLTMI